MSCENIVRLNADGSLDEDFYLKNMRRKSEVRALALQIGRAHV